MKERKIITEYEKIPVGRGKYDWLAFREDIEPYEPFGYGTTEQEAINDLLEKEEERSKLTHLN
jgi:hypothetical protein